MLRCREMVGRKDGRIPIELTSPHRRSDYGSTVTIRTELSPRPADNILDEIWHSSRDLPLTLSILPARQLIDSMPPLPRECAP